MNHIRSLLIGWICTVMEWNSHIHYADLNHPIGWRDHLRWLFEGWLTRIFALAYAGSDEELRDAEDIPAKHRSLRQRDHVLGYPEFPARSCYTFGEWLLDLIGILLCAALLYLLLIF